MKMERSVPKRWRIKFIRRGITQKKAYSIIVSYSLTIFVIYWAIYPSPMPVPVAARSKAWVYCRSPAEIVGSDPAGL